MTSFFDLKSDDLVEYTDSEDGKVYLALVERVGNDPEDNQSEDSESDREEDEEEDEDEKLALDETQVWCLGTEDIKILKTAELRVIDRLMLMQDVVAKTSEPFGQSGIVVGVHIFFDLRSVVGNRIIKEVGVEHLTIDDPFYEDVAVVYDNWIGEVKKTYYDVVVLFNDGTVARVHDSTYRALEPIEADLNEKFHVGMRVKLIKPSRATWIGGRTGRIREGVVICVDPSKCKVEWNSSADTQAVPPPSLIPTAQLKLLEHYAHLEWRAGEHVYCHGIDAIEEIVHSFAAVNGANWVDSRARTAQIIKTRTRVDVRWQDGVLQRDIESRDLVRLQHFGAHDFWPEDLVIQKTNDFENNQQENRDAKYGVVRKVDASSRMCDVQWLGHYNDGLHPYLIDDDDDDDDDGPKEEQVSVYEIECIAEYEYSVGNIVLPCMEEDNQRDNVCFGEIVRIKDGFVEILWLNGEVEKLRPDQVLLIDFEEDDDDDDWSTVDSDDEDVSTTDYIAANNEDAVAFSPQRQRSHVHFGSASPDAIQQQQQQQQQQFDTAAATCRLESSQQQMLMQVQTLLITAVKEYLDSEQETLFNDRVQQLQEVIIDRIENNREVSERFPRDRTSPATPQDAEAQVQRTAAMHQETRQLINDVVEMMHDKRLKTPPKAFQTILIALKDHVGEIEGRREAAEDENPQGISSIGRMLLMLQAVSLMFVRPAAVENNEEVIEVDEVDDEEEEPTSTAVVNSNNNCSNGPAAVENSDSNNNNISNNPDLSTFAGTSSFQVVSGVPPDHKFRSNAASAQISIAWLGREHRNLREHLPAGIHVVSFDERLDLIRCVIAGAVETPYAGAIFTFDLYLPPTYPNDPPHVSYHSIGERLNPNLYVCGKVCLSILGTWHGKPEEMWDPKVSNLLQVFVSMQALVLNCDPYYNEAGYERQMRTEEGVINSRLYNEGAMLLSLQTIPYNISHAPAPFEAAVRQHFAFECPRIIQRMHSLLQKEAKGREVAIFYNIPHPPSDGFLRLLAKTTESLERAVAQL